MSGLRGPPSTRETYMYMSDGFSSARYPCTQEALGAGEKRSFSEGTYLRFALGVRVLYFFLTLEPSVEWYNNLRALNTSPPRNRSAFLLSGCSSIENCTTWYSSHSDFERGVVGDVRRSPGERTDACMAWTGRTLYPKDLRLQPTPYSLKTTPYTLHPQDYTLHFCQAVGQGPHGGPQEYLTYKKTHPPRTLP